MNKYDLQTRFKVFAIGIIKLVRALPNQKEYWKISDQVIRSGTASAANYRAACRAKSNADFIYKLKIVEEELDETMFWIEIIQSILPKTNDNATVLYKEANELLSITVASIKTMKGRANIRR